MTDAQTLQVTDEDILLLIDRIIQSKAIPSGHKEKYIEYLQKNGLTETFLEELDKMFEKDEALVSQLIADKEKLLKNLDEEIAQEDAETDRPQAELLVAFREVAEDDVKAVKEELDEFDQGLEIAVEEVGKEAETSEIESIRAELQKKK